jgi:hypothetical protein
MWQGNPEVFSFGEDLLPFFLRKAFNVLPACSAHKRQLLASPVLPAVAVSAALGLFVISNGF